MGKLAIHGGAPVRESTLPYGRQSVRQEDVRTVVEVLGSEWLTTGPAVDRFEAAFRKVVEAGNAVAVSSGTAALHGAMYAIGLGPRDEVIVPTITFAATANCAVHLGAKPVFADVDPDTLLVDPDDVAAKVTPRTKAIVGVDYAGSPCDYDRLGEIAGEGGTALLADAAHSLGAESKGRPVGTLADANCFSFHPVKIITTGEGGMVTTDDERIAERARRFRNHGMTVDFKRRARRATHYYEIHDPGFNYRLTDLQAALGTAQLSRLPEFLARRRRIAADYDARLRDVPGCRPLERNPADAHALHLYVILVDTEDLGASRDELFAALRAEGIGVNVHYLPVHLQPFYRRELGTGPGDCPVAEDAYERMLTLPLFPAMTDEDIDDVEEAVRKVFGHYRAHGSGSPASP